VTNGLNFLPTQPHVCCSFVKTVDRLPFYCLRAFVADLRLGCDKHLLDQNRRLAPPEANQTMRRNGQVADAINGGTFCRSIPCGR
jgi:hypothetical protein